MSQGRKIPGARRPSSAESKNHRRKVQAIASIMDTLAALDEGERAGVIRAVKEAMGIPEPIAFQYLPQSCSIPSVWPAANDRYTWTAGTPDVGAGNGTGG